MGIKGQHLAAARTKSPQKGTQSDHPDQTVSAAGEPRAASHQGAHASRRDLAALSLSLGEPLVFIVTRCPEDRRIHSKDAAGDTRRLRILIEQRAEGLRSGLGYG